MTDRVTVRVSDPESAIWLAVTRLRIVASTRFFTPPGTRRSEEEEPRFTR
jgi:hypothetical protein